MNSSSVKTSDNSARGPGQREADFVHALDNMTVASKPLEPFKSTDCTFTSFPVFALSPQVSEPVLKEAAKAFHEQAQAELGLNEEEMAEMGPVASVPAHWQLHERSPMDAAQWYLNDFEKSGKGTVREPEWFPYGFLGIANVDWKQNGVVVVLYKDHDELLPGETLPLVAFVASPEKIGSTLNTLRQHNDHFDNVKEDDSMA